MRNVIKKMFDIKERLILKVVLNLHRDEEKRCQLVTTHFSQIPFKFEQIFALFNNFMFLCFVETRQKRKQNDFIKVRKS